MCLREGSYLWLYLSACMIGHTYSKSKDQPRKVANPARGQLNRGKMNISPSPLVPENLVSRDGFGRVPARVRLFIYILRLNLVLAYGFSSDFDMYVD